MALRASSAGANFWADSFLLRPAAPVPGDFGGVSTSEHTGYGAVRTDQPKTTSADDRPSTLAAAVGVSIRRLPRAAPQRGQSLHLCPQWPGRRLERV